MYGSHLYISDYKVLATCLVVSLVVAFTLPNSSRIISHNKNVVDMIQSDLNALETQVSSTLLDRDFFQDLLDVVQARRPVTNDMMSKMTALSQEPYSIYVYKDDTLLYWSKPGLIIDPASFEEATLPAVASNHITDFLIRDYSIHHDFTDYQVYAKIPIVTGHFEKSDLNVVSINDDMAAAEEWQLVRTQDGTAVCAINFSKRKLGFWQQVALLVDGIIIFVLASMWLFQLSLRLAPRLYEFLGFLLPVGLMLLVRTISLCTGYHSAFDALLIFEPFGSGGWVPYSLADLLFDSVLFVVATVIGARAPRSTFKPSTKRLEQSMTTVGAYLVLLLSIGLFIWLQRWLVLDTRLPFDLEHISFVSGYNAIVFTCLACLIFGLFMMGQRILGDLPEIQSSIYRRIGSITFAGLISLAFIPMLDLNLPLFGFYAASLSILVLYDLYSEATTKSVIWVICWSVLLAGFEATLLHSYQSDKDFTVRQEIALEIASDLDANQKERAIDEIMLAWLPKIPGKYSVGIFNQGKLSYSYNYAYPLVVPVGDKTTEESSDHLRSEVSANAGDFAVLIGRRNADIMQLVSLFSYIFALFNIFLFFVSLSNSFVNYLPSSVNLSFSSRPTLRNRIQVAIVFLIILSFVIIGFVTVFYLRNTSEDRDKKYFEDRLRTIATSINQAVPGDLNSYQMHLLAPKVAGIAYVHNRQAKLFDNTGNLILQGRSANGFVNSEVKMAFVDKFEMDQSGRSYSIKSVSTDRGFTYHGLIAMRDNNNETKGYVELPATSMIQNADAGSKFFGTLLNAYVFLFLIAVALAIGVANSITRPLAQLGEKLKKLKLGKKNEAIQWGIDDEIGALIKDYNQMIKQLDQSATLMAQTERDNAWREMAKQVAHEIKNPLTPMKLSIQYLQNGVDQDPEKLKSLVGRVSNTLIEQIDNLSIIASEFSNFAKMPLAENEKVLLNDVVASVHDLFRKRDDMDVQLYVPIQDIYVFADRNLMIRVLNNVVKNAIQAIPVGKRGQINISLQKRDENAIIVVEDNGSGIPADMRTKVFTPNFTTKSSGTGLGLAICANIIETFNGRIYFETEQAKGTKFYIEIPLMKFDDNVLEQPRVVL